MSKALRIATRATPLALAQTELIKQQLLAAFPDLTIETIEMTTSGDKNLSAPLYKLGGDKGLFTKELEVALLDNRADIAVHCIKDLPAEMPEGLILACIPRRGDPRDVMVSLKYKSPYDLPPGAVVGTSSLRRQAQILKMCPQVKVEFIRGSVNTRLQRLEEGKYDAILLAAAGLERLGLQEKISYYFSTTQFIPAVGQGALGIQCRLADSATQQLLQKLVDPVSTLRVIAERAMVNYLNVGCHAPVAVYTYIQDKKMMIQGWVGDPNGKEEILIDDEGLPEKAEQLGVQVAQALLSQGADKIIARCNAAVK